MIYSEQTIVDKVIYNRVPLIRKTINDGLIQRLFEQVGDYIHISELVWDYTDIPSNCCKKMEVKVSILINDN